MKKILESIPQSQRQCPIIHLQKAICVKVSCNKKSLRVTMIIIPTQATLILHSNPREESPFQATLIRHIRINAPETPKRSMYLKTRTSWGGRRSVPIFLFGWDGGTAFGRGLGFIFIGFLGNCCLTGKRGKNRKSLCLPVGLVE